MDSLAQTVEVRAFSSDGEMNSAMQKKLEAIYVDILASPPVAEAYAGYEAAQQRVAHLKKAQASLTRRARQIFDEMKEVSSEIDKILIEQDSSQLDLRKLADLENEHKAVTRANSKILEHLLPQAEIAELKRAADHLTVKAYTVREAANERIQKTARMMAEAAEHEGGILFDSLTTLSGEMLRQASEFERQAGNYRNWAREREEQYLKLARELESIGSVR